MYFLREHAAVLQNVLSLLLLLHFTVTDIKRREISSKVVLIGIAVGGLLVLGQGSMTACINGIAGMLAAGMVFGIGSFVSKEGIGKGDVKMMSCIGLCHGFQTTMGFIFLSLLFAVLFGVALVCFRKATRKTELPFAPFVFAANIVHIVIVG